MAIRICRPGLLTTIQDLGRFGSQKYGITVSGAMDSLSLRIANVLVGNEESEAALEITLLGPEILFESDCLISITGGNLKPTVDGHLVPMWRPIFLKKGTILKFNTAISGCRAYLAVSGGFNVSNYFGSKSTHLEAEIGGLNGRPLQTEDLIICNGITKTGEKIINSHANNSIKWAVYYKRWFNLNSTQTIRVLKGSEYDYFDANSQKRFLSNPYKITTKSNRMGYNLKGEKIKLQTQHELISEAVTFGTIQVPAQGHPIILMADRQTVGGYPKIAQVITADLPKLGQMKPKDTIYFDMVSLEEAEKLLFEHEKMVDNLKISILSRVY